MAKRMLSILSRAIGIVSCITLLCAFALPWIQNTHTFHGTVTNSYLWPELNIIGWISPGFFFVLILTMISLMTFILKRRGKIWVAINLVLQVVPLIMFYTVYTTYYDYLARLEDSVTTPSSGFYLAVTSSVLIILASLAYTYLPITDYVIEEGETDSDMESGPE